MQAFKYKGYDAAGSPVQGQINAATVEEAERRVAAQDVTIIAILPAGARRGGGAASGTESGALFKKKTLSAAEGAGILENLAVMAETGVPFVEALDAVAAGAKNPKTSELLYRMKEEILGGKSLSSAMREIGGLFPELVSDMVRVAEEGGRLDESLRAAATYLERQAELRKRVLNAMLYPAVMLTISVVTVLVLVVFVMPRFAAIFTKMGVDVPATTQLMLSSGEFIRSHPIHFVLGVVGVAVGGRLLLRNPVADAAASRLLLRLPLLGDLFRRLALARAFGSLATLLSGNVSIMAAMEHAAKVSGVREVREGFLRARASVEHGKSLAEAFEEAGVIPSTMLNMVSVGEKTGRLAPILATTAQRMEADVDSRLKALVSIVEPAMIVFMGVVVGTITLSIIGPIYSVVQNIK